MKRIPTCRHFGKIKGTEERRLYGTTIRGKKTWLKWNPEWKKCPVCKKPSKEER